MTNNSSKVLVVDNGTGVRNKVNIENLIYPFYYSLQKLVTLERISQPMYSPL